MKRITKILIFSLLLVCLCSASAFASDLDGYKHEKEVKLIMGMGIMNGYEDGNFRPDNQITRAEFVTVLMRTLGWTAESGGTSVFWDMENHWAADYVNKAYELGVANGVGNGAFAPDDLVLCQQAVKLVNGVLGYQDVVAQRGGYPAGDISVGIDNALFTGLSAGYEKPLTRGQAAKLIANALKAKTLNVEYFTIDSKTMTKGATLLECLGYSVQRINVTSAWGGSIDGTVLENKYQIASDGKIYKTTFADSIKYLGMTVDAYIYNAGGDDEVICYLGETGLEKIVSVYTDDIVNVDLNSEIKYKNGSKKAELRIANLVAIKNGVRLSTSEVTEELFTNSNSRIDFIDSDGENGFETALIWSMDEYIVNRVADDKVYCEYNRSVDLSTLDEDKEITIVYNGRFVTIDAIQQGDVITVSKSVDGKKIRVDITRDKTCGEITAELEETFASSKTKKSFTVSYNGAEKTLYLSNSYMTEYTANRGYFTKPMVGDRGTFYLNQRGEIAYMAIGVMLDTDEIDPTYLDRNTYKYGYLNEVGGRVSGRTPLQIELLTQDNEFVIFDIADKIKLGAYVDGRYSVKKTDVSDCYEILSVQPQQVVKYRVDEDGNLVELCLSENGTNSSAWGKREASLTRQFANSQLDQQYVVDSTTICFYVPVLVDDDSWKVSKAVTMLKSGSSYKTDLIDVVDGKVGVLLYRPTLSTTRYKYVLDYVNSPVMLIDNVVTKLDEASGDYKKTITGWVNGEYKEVMVANTLENNSNPSENLRQGMLIQYLLNTEKRGFARYKDDSPELILFNSICDFNNLGEDFITWDYTSVTDANARIKVYKATVTYVDNDIFYVSIGGDTYVAAMHGGTNVMKKSSDGSGTFVKAAIEDVTVGSTVLVRQRYNNTRDVFILN